MKSSYMRKICVKLLNFFWVLDELGGNRGISDTEN